MSSPEVRSEQELAVRALLRMLWQALQPHHFWIGLYVGLFLGVAVMALAVWL